jgi:membrane protease subunit HflC
MKPITINILVAAISLLVIASLSLFVVDQRRYAIVFQLGEIVRVEDQPGIKWKLPLVQSVLYFDKRIQTVDATEPERYITSEKKNVMVDAFVKWRIADVKQYYISVSGDENRAQIRLMQTVNSAMREEFGKHTIHDVVSGEREKIMAVLREKTNADAKNIGVEVLDVRLKRVDYPSEISSKVYNNMEAERKIAANKLRATGFADKEKLSADADRQRQVILADAYRDAQRIKGEGDAKATAIYANAFSHNPEFFAFYRSLEAYKQSFKNKGDMLVIDPNSEFFKYLKKGAGK